MAKLKILKPFSRFRAGDIVTVEVDENGTPVDKFWRRRVKDSERDGCLELVKPSKKRKVTESEKEGSDNADPS